MGSKPLRKKSKRAISESQQFERISSLSWSPSLLEQEDPFSFFTGSNELEGGFLSLEETDESHYELEIPVPEKQTHEKRSKGKAKLKKHKTSGDVLDSNEDDKSGDEVEDKGEKERISMKRKRKQKKDKKKPMNNKLETHEKEAEPVTDGKCAQGDSIDEAEYHAWTDLRLHPLLMESVYRLKFKEPTPIQKACIPTAAHQGKDVIGAAETGSGKTLAFGFPILQRLLEEREKADKLLGENGEVDDRITSRGFLRALVIAPTRELALQVTDHLKEAAKGTDIRVVSIVGGMSTEKQERLLKNRPEIVVGTPGRLWELMSGREIHLIELHSLSFFVLDEADRMIENGHFDELQSIIDMLPASFGTTQDHTPISENCVTISSFQRKKRQTFVFSATISLSTDFRKKLKRGVLKSKENDELNSIERLSERAGIRENVAVVDLTNASILANKLEESLIECKEEDKDAYLYYILSVHGQGRTIVFCTSIAALRHLSSILRTLEITVWTLHAQMQQRARLKAIDRFRVNEHGILIATDVAARGLDIPGVRTVVHYQLPHSAEVYVHRSGRTARAFADGCSIALISPNEASKFAALCRSFSKEIFQRFPVELSYMPEVRKRLSLARQIDKILRKGALEKSRKSWLERNAESAELDLENDDSEEERVNKHKQRKTTSVQLKTLQKELKMIISRPLQPETFSRRFLAGAGVSPLLQHQFEELSSQKLRNVKNSTVPKRHGKMVVIGQDCVEPLHALRGAAHEVMNLKVMAEKRRNVDDIKRKRKEEKKRLRDQLRNQRKKLKAGKE